MRRRVCSRAPQARGLLFVEGDHLADGRQGQRGISRPHGSVADLDRGQAQGDQEGSTTGQEPDHDDDRPGLVQAGIECGAEDEDTWHGEQPPGERYAEPFAVIMHAPERS